MAMQKLFFVFLLILSCNNTSCYSSSNLDSVKETFGNFPKYLGRSLKASQKTFNLITYGAKGDGTADDTKAFQKAWMAVCASTQSAVLLIPNNKKFLLKPITLSGPCKSPVEVAIQGTIVAPSRSAWNLKSTTHWILFQYINNLKLSGGGTVNGNGNAWWQNSCKINKSKPCTKAPTAMTFYSCNNLLLEKLNVRDSQQIHVSIEKCNNVNVASVTVTAPSSSPNTDGLHISSTTNIVITNCVIKTGDDCMSIETGTKNLKATKITCGPGHGISIGSLGDGYSRAQVSDILIDTVKLYGTTNGARIKTYQGGSGYAKNIVFQNIVMSNVKNPIIIDQNYCDSSKPCKSQKSAVEVSGIVFKNIKGTSASDVAINLSCSKTVACRGIQLQNINLVSQNNKSTRSTCQNAKWSKSGTVIPPPCASTN
ncbi:Pectin lyase-like superfamily protein [Rhynchospora pubera]|uniref:endo-polygalacturonase n=1 Tax=Rhynchospora pubera TaxID=906938 RepID=A0AAV8CX34_9POAL|nr:Pectin lyase-like superfamily protein [Rhynchospora pubera]